MLLSKRARARGDCVACLQTVSCDRKLLSLLRIAQFTQVQQLESLLVAIFNSNIDEIPKVGFFACNNDLFELLDNWKSRTSSANASSACTSSNKRIRA